MPEARPLAVVTGASSGIGRELARCCAADGYDLVIAADEPLIHDVAEELSRQGVCAIAVEADLASAEGVEALIAALEDRPVEMLLANAGRGLGDAFVNQDFGDIIRVVDTNITGSLLLVHSVAAGMASRGRGRILFTGSIAGFIPGSYQAVYNASKAFIGSFSWALRNELKESGVTVTCLMPGPTDTEFFARADMEDTPLGASGGKADAAKVARSGYYAMMEGKDGVVTGFSNKIQAAMAHVLPASMLAERHGRMAEPEGDTRSG